VRSPPRGELTHSHTHTEERERRKATPWRTHTHAHTIQREREGRDPCGEPWRAATGVVEGLILLGE
jgi:hypothetical protein